MGAPETPETTETRETSETIGRTDAVTGLRKHMLRSLRERGGTATTTEVVRDAEVPSGSRGRHFSVLEEAGLVEKTEMVIGSHGSRVQEWQLTEKGAEVMLEDATSSSRPSVDDLEEEVEDLRAEVRNLREHKRKTHRLQQVLLDVIYPAVDEESQARIEEALEANE
ncbi:hypothetical protein ACFO0N_07310 [Halobium salinum]|uniref:Helix-turn-helix domain-containing protein n=1 Tax=Halobium salinum TaxID=1364940 RepID=A0ABD5PA40_9EURY|nr:hypothetical protein [Halobium salinum]